MSVGFTVGTDTGAGVGLGDGAQDDTDCIVIQSKLSPSPPLFELNRKTVLRAPPVVIQNGSDVISVHVFDPAAPPK